MPESIQLSFEKVMTKMSDDEIDQHLTEISSERDRLHSVAIALVGERERRATVKKAREIHAALGSEGVKELLRLVAE